MPKRKELVWGALEDFLEGVGTSFYTDVELRRKMTLWQMPTAFSTMLKKKWDKLDRGQFYRAIRVARESWGWDWRRPSAADIEGSPKTMPFADIGFSKDSQTQVRRVLIQAEISSRLACEGVDKVTQLIELAQKFRSDSGIAEAKIRAKEHDKLVEKNFQYIAKTFCVFFTSPTPFKEIKGKYMFYALLIAVMASIAELRRGYLEMEGSASDLYPALLTITDYLMKALNRLPLAADSQEEIARIKNTQMMAEVKKNLEETGAKPARYLW
ncbi:MAG: hypothetical protein K0S08_546 [Gammaproteobacteria bacterium]|jgi:hypothetical protein|nr:hypothetical protein [Gammaproteobacteria bacterium]